MMLAKSKADGNLRWPPGAKAKGAVLVLGDPMRARTVAVAEGESDALSAWLASSQQVRTARFGCGNRYHG